MKKYNLYIILTFLIASCSNDANKKKFTLLSSKKSGISFNNKLVENDTLNYFTFPYIYMGGGVSTGDINNDGLVDIYFTGNMVDNKLYLNKGNMVFEDITDSSGTNVYQPVVGFGAVGIKTLNKGCFGSVCKDGPTIPVTKPTLNKPSLGYSTNTTLRNLVELSLKKVSRSCLRVL